MKRPVTLVLLAVNLALAAALALLWFKPGEGLRNARWQPPAPVRPDLSFALPAGGDMNLSAFVATLDRPLFSPSRQPPPKAVAGAAAPADPLAGIRLQAVYMGPGGGGIIAQVDGRSRRIRLNEKLGDWTLKAIQDRTVTFARGGEERKMELVASRGAPAPGAPAGAAAGEAAPSRPTAHDMRQKMLEAQRARLAARNAIRARAGLPPVE